MILPSVAYFLVVESSVVMPGTGRNGLVLRGIGLDNDPPWTGATPCPARHLAKKLEGAFAGTKVRKVEDRGGGDYPDPG